MNVGQEKDEADDGEKERARLGTDVKEKEGRRTK